MRQVAVAEAKDAFSKLVAAAEAGEEIAITRHGREVARLVPPELSDAESRRRVFETLEARRADMRRRGVQPTTHAEMLEWIAEGRR